MTTEPQETTSYSSQGILSGSQNKYTQEVLVLVADGARATAKIGAEVERDTREYELSIREFSLMFGETGYARAVPELQIASDDGRASHSATTEKISADMLAYFASRGIPETLARKIFVSSKAASMYTGLPEAIISLLTEHIFQKLRLS